MEVNGMKALIKRLVELRQKEAVTQNKINTSDDIDEVRELGSTLQSIRDEINEVEKEIEEKEAEGEGNDGEGSGEEGDDQRGFNPAEMNMRKVGTPGDDDNSNDARSTMEYRTAFMNYIQKGERSDVLQFEERADASGDSSDLGVLIPQTVIQEIIKGVEKVYGQLYADVTKTNVPGGVKYPIGSFVASFNRISENGKSDRQDAGGVTGSVEFSYKIGEIKLARTILQTVLSVEAFEKEFANVVVEAYVKAMDVEIMTGNASNNEMVGILTEAEASNSRIPEANVIEMSEADVADWTQWQKKVFAQIPISMRREGYKFVMTGNTYEANIKTLKDDNNRPVYNETFNPVDGAEKCTFKAKEVTLVENDILADFDDASDGDYFAMLWVPKKAYAINSNMQFTVIDYTDHDNNKVIKKALVINDGKVLDGKYIYLLKKTA